MKNLFVEFHLPHVITPVRANIFEILIDDAVNAFFMITNILLVLIDLQDVVGERELIIHDCIYLSFG